MANFDVEDLDFDGVFGTRTYLEAKPGKKVWLTIKKKMRVEDGRLIRWKALVERL